MPDVKIKGYSGTYFEYQDVPMVYLAAPESTEENPVLVPFSYGEAAENVEIIPDFAEGDQKIAMLEGYLAKSAVVRKPDSLRPDNIKKGEKIAGILGEYEGEQVSGEEVTMALAMADGDMVIEPSAVSKVLSKVTIQKPETLIPENIAEGIDIAGIIGTFAGGDADAPKIFVKTIPGNSGTTGLFTLATAEELAEIGFADASKKFAALIVSNPDTNSANNLAFSIANSWGMGLYQASSRNAIYGYTVKSGYYYNLSTGSMYTKLDPTNTYTYSNTIFGYDGELVYNLASTYNLNKNSSVAYYLIVGVLS